jgi:hypothetical protein
MAAALQGLFHARWKLHEMVGTGRMPVFLLFVTSNAEQIGFLLQRRILDFSCRFNIRQFLMALQAGLVIENTLWRDHQRMRVRLLEARALMACKAYRITGRPSLPQKIDIKNSSQHIFIHLRLNIMTGEATELSTCQGPACGQTRFHLIRDRNIDLMHLESGFRAGAMAPVAQGIYVTA